MTDSDRAELERLIIEALAPITKKHGIDVTILVHPPGEEPFAGHGADPQVRFFLPR